MQRLGHVMDGLSHTKRHEDKIKENEVKKEPSHSAFTKTKHPRIPIFITFQSTSQPVSPCTGTHKK